MRCYISGNENCPGVICLRFEACMARAAEMLEEAIAKGQIHPTVGADGKPRFTPAEVKAVFPKE
jgi:hypothetical protein